MHPPFLEDEAVGFLPVHTPVDGFLTPEEDIRGLSNWQEAYLVFEKIYDCLERTEPEHSN
ncbi:hypothetical protein APTSU1_000601800 [Apodemus speciosus]|uniref:Uncharacterized protein n=1 Tax=Apodemus speciosus TaxID=105296 RepID=A0ABQ0EUT2_APOSI